jgi:exopolysaccharide production protein ExoZ
MFEPVMAPVLAQKAFAAEDGAGTRRLLSIQYLRAIAALLVVLHHARNEQAWLFNPMAGTRFGVVGVDIFFVISGFIMFTAARHESVLEFVRRRIIRVVPLYWLATMGFVVFCAVVLPLVSQGIRPVHIVKSLLFIPHQSASDPGRLWPVLVPGWTLNYEMFFYAVFAVGLVSRHVVVVASAALCALVGLGLVLQPSKTSVATVYTSPLLLEFLAGVLVGRLRASISMRRMWPALPIGALAGVLLSCSPLTPAQLAVSRYFPALLIVAGAVGLEQVRPLRELRVWRLLGDASYAIYLTHPITLYFVGSYWSRAAVTGLPQFALVVSSSLAASALVGVIVHVVLEKPLLGWLHTATRPARASAGRVP